MVHKWSVDALFAAMTFAAPSMTSQAQATERCPAGGLTVVATGLDTPVHLTLDGDFLYFVDEFNGPARVAKSGGVPERFSGLQGSNPPFVYGGAAVFDIAVDSTRIYVSRPGILDPSPTESEVFVFDKTTALVYDVPGKGALLPSDCHIPWIREIALGPGGDLFWLHEDFPRPFLCSNGGPQSGVVWLQAGSTRPQLVWRTEGIAHRLRADATHLFWVDVLGVERSEAAGGRIAASLIDATTRTIADMNIDANNVYWSTANDGTGQPATYRVSAPGQRQQIFDDVLTEIVTDGIYVYGDAPRSGPGAPFDVFRLKPNGHGVYNLAKGGGGGLAVDDTYIYYVDARQTSILRTCKLEGL